MITVTVAKTILGLDALAVRIDEATRQIAGDAAHVIQAQSMMQAPVGKPGNTTNAPGDLRRSIMVEGPAGADGVYTARVGPTVVYGRQRELGGPIFPQRASALVFTKFGTTYVVGPGVFPGAKGTTVFVAKPGVNQEANPYMARGEAAALPLIPDVARARIAEAILGG